MEQEILKKVQDEMFEIALEFKRVCDELGIDYFMEGGTLLGAVRHKDFIPWDDDMDFGMLRKNYEIFLKEAPKRLKPEYFLQTLESDENYGLVFAKLRKNNTVYLEEASEFSGAHAGFFVDIFPHDVLPDGEKERKKLRRQRWIYKRLLIGKCNYTPWVGGRDSKGKVLIKKSVYKIIGFLAKFRSKDALIKKYDEIATKYNQEASEYYYHQEANLGNGEHPLKRACIENVCLLPFRDTEFKAPSDWATYLETLYGDYMKLPPVEERENRHLLKKIEFNV